MSSIFPMGYIYMSVENVDPGRLFGGTWTKLGGRFLLAAGDTYAAGSTGGAATHTLTVAQMPAHKHKIARVTNTRGDSDYYKGFSVTYYSSDPLVTRTHLAGGGQAHNNMPPYLAVNMWERTG